MVEQAGRAGAFRLPRSFRSLINGCVMLRLLYTLLVALALFFSSLAMSSDSPAMAHASSVASADATGHCRGDEDRSDTAEAGVTMDCLSSCSAVQPAPTPVAQPVETARMEVTIASYPTLIGLRPEGETPPPRITPEV